MRKLNQLKAGSILTYVNLAIGCIIPLFYTPIMLQLLGQEEYGVYSLANSVASYLSLLNFGMGSAVIRYTAKFRAENRPDEVRRMLGLFILIYSCMATLVCITGMVLIQFSGALLGKGLTPEEVSTMQKLLFLMTLNTAISFPLGLFGSITLTYERYIYHRAICIAETIISPVLNLTVLYLGFGSMGMAIIGLMVTLLNGMLYSAYCIKKLHIYPVFRNMPVGILKEVIVFSAFVFLSSIVDMMYWATDKVLIGAMIGSAAVAVYNVGGTFTTMLQNLAHAISGVFSSRVNIMVAKDTPKQELSELLIRVGRLQYLLVSLILSGYIVFGHDFIRLWAGPEYGDAYYIALMTMIPIAIPLIQSIAFATILAENKHRFRSIIYAAVAVVNIVATYLVLPYYGIIGAAVCTSAAYTLGQGVIMNIYYYRVTKLDIPAFWMNILKMSITPGILIVVGSLLVRYVLPTTSLVWLLIWIVAYTVLFVAGSWAISMNRYEKDLFLGLIKKVLPKR